MQDFLTPGLSTSALLLMWVAAVSVLSLAQGGMDAKSIHAVRIRCCSCFCSVRVSLDNQMMTLLDKDICKCPWSCHNL